MSDTKIIDGKVIAADLRAETAIKVEDFKNKFDRDLMIERGFSLDNPAYLAAGNVLSGLANIPLDRAFMILNNVREASNSENEAWQRVAMMLGWNTWDVGVNPYEDESDSPKRKTPQRKTPTRKTPKRNK